MTKDSVQPLHHERIAISRGMVPDVTNGTYPGDLLMPALKRVRMLQRPAVVLIFGVTRVVAPESRAGDLRAVGHRWLAREARRCGGPGQLVFRAEDDRLAVLVPDESLATASALAEATRREVCERFQEETGAACIVSVGVAELTETNGPQRAEEQATQALQLAESWGGGEVVKLDATTPVDAANDSPARALVVEDDPSIRMLVCQTLQRAGFEVHEAFDGREGLARLRSASFDIVILDVMMPGVGGIEMCKEMRASSTLASVPVLMVSALADPVDRVNGLEIADDYLCKPFACDELVARARALLRRVHSTPPPQPRSA